MENVTDRVSNPFGMRPPSRPAVHGYGDANADFHIIGESPDAHGGKESGVPFSSQDASRVHDLLDELGFVESRDPLRLRNAFMSYVRLTDDDPVDEAVRYFDAELRAVNAHILVPVGDFATRHVIETYTASGPKLRSTPLEELHATEIHGMGFLVIPALDPRDWDDKTYKALRDELRDVLESDYRQTKGVATRRG
ncbi:MAG: uracil-DNA glycosylase family protein [Halobacteria archaeon]